MQTSPSLSTPPTQFRADVNRSLVPQLQRSEIFQEYRKAFESTTGLPLALRAVGSFQSPLHGSKRLNPFCALMAATNKSCAACLQLQQRVETEATAEPKTLECFAGLSESAVPVHAGGQVLGYLQTGQVFRQPPSKTHFKRISRQLEQWGTPSAVMPQLEAAYFQTRVIAKKQYESVVRLLGIFARHLASVSNQVMVSESQSELPAIARARAFIAEQQSEDLSLADVARVAGMSVFYFCKLFRKATGLTFTEYLARVRIESVKQMLLNPHARMSETAYAAGFQSLSQFNRVFHRIVGETPSSYHERLHHATRASSSPFSLAHAA